MAGRLVLLVTGNINLNGQNNVIVQNGVTFKLYGDKDINFQGDSFNNQNVNGAGGPVTSSLYVYGVDTAGKTIISDNAANPNQTFVGVIYEPGYYINVKSSFNLYGSVTGSTTQTSAAASYHYDEALGTASGGGTMYGSQLRVRKLVRGQLGYLSQGWKRQSYDLLRPI